MSEHEHEPVLEINPIPVYIVQDSLDDTQRSATPNNIILPPAGQIPVQICSRDGNRTHVYLLNESSSSNIRFSRHSGNLTNGGGALLPWPGNSYFKLSTQDELWAISADAGSPIISVIQEYDKEIGDM